MSRVQNLLRVGLAVGVVGIASCTSDDASTAVLGPHLTGANSIFQHYVSLGNSITAGYQSGGINDSTQRRAYPVLFAQQVSAHFAYPSLFGRGCAPPIANFQTQARVGNGTSATCDLRNPSTATDVIDNVAVPGATVSDLTATTGTSASNILTSLFLGGKTEVTKAIQADPTFASIWIGNNDVLAAAASGVLVPLAGVSPGVTPQATFTQKYDDAVGQLVAGSPNLQGGMLFGVVNVASIPLLFQEGVFVASPAFLAGFDQAAGRNPASTDPYKAAALTLDPNCAGAAAATLVSFLIAPQIAAFRNDTNATGSPPKDPATRRGHPPIIACGNHAGLPAIVGEIFILTTAEQTALGTAVANYNAYIQTKATSLGWAYWNPNQVLDSLKAAGQIPAAPNLANPTATFGAWFTLDGVHPSSQAHRALANHMIDSVNAKYGTAIGRLTVP